jgi:hypothetical protein
VFGQDAEAFKDIGSFGRPKFGLVSPVELLKKPGIVALPVLSCLASAPFFWQLRRSCHVSGVSSSRVACEAGRPGRPVVFIASLILLSQA